MKTFNEFVNESLASIKTYNKNNPKGSWHAGGTKSHRILIFDIDDTLLTGECYINILDKNSGEFLHRVNSNEFNTYKAKPNEVFDFSEFADPDVFDQNKLTHYFDTMKREYMRGTHIALLTARGGKDVGDMIRYYFLKKGIDIKEELVICINTEDSPYTGTTAEKKAQAMEDLRDAGYTTMVFFDDNEDNIKQAKKIGWKIGVKMVAIHADIHRPDYEKDIRTEE